MPKQRSTIEIFWHIIVGVLLVIVVSTIAVSCATDPSPHRAAGEQLTDRLIQCRQLDSAAQTTCVSKAYELEQSYKSVP